MSRRPGTGSSTRSRRDEVWEVKRQRWLQRQGGGYPDAQPARGGAGGNRPPPLGQLDQVAARQEQGTNSPLSRLVATGYPHEQRQASAHQPYGERPSSGHAQMANGVGGGGGGGFDANIGQQWSSNVRNQQQEQQSRHDPNVSGPARAQGGQRVTQPSGGHSNIDLSFGSGQPMPPRMPGSGGGQSHNGGRSPASIQQQQYSGSAAGSHRGASPSNAGRQGSIRTSPFGRDDDDRGSGLQQRQREAAPFGTDAGAGGAPAGGRGSSRGAGQRENSRGGSPFNQQQQQQQYPPQQQQQHQPQQQQYQQQQQQQQAPYIDSHRSGCGGLANIGGQDAGGFRGRAAARPPGGGSSIVFG